MKVTYEKLADWLVPVLLAAAVYSLGEIRKEIAAMGTSIAVVATKIDEHEKRLTKLERGD